jgi:hypothetical protein
MYNRNLIPILVVFFSIIVVSASYAVPRDPAGVVMDIDHKVIPFWQGGDSFTGINGTYLGVWGCNKMNVRAGSTILSLL